MNIIERIAAYQADMTEWRRDLHAHPETAFEESRTAAFVVAKLRDFGVDVHIGLAKTGVVGTLRAGTGNRAVGLRADMDALHIQEANQFPHRSRNQGKMHACGHDGHTTMLLGAARYLAETRAFDGTVHFIFQPAEEMEGGGRVMVEEGLFVKFPCDAVFGLHNLPGIPVGQFGARSGSILASADIFTIRVKGRGAHAAFPHQGVDPIVIAAEIVLALQTIPARNVDPMQSAVVSVTRIGGGNQVNAIPDEVELAGTVRTFLPETQKLIERRIRAIAGGIAATHGGSVEIAYEYRYPPTINTVAETEVTAIAAAKVVGSENVLRNLPPSMACEDFAFMLQVRPGSHALIGNGAGEGSCMVHNPHYDFNDEILALGATYWVRLAETFLARP